MIVVRARVDFRIGAGVVRLSLEGAGAETYVEVAVFWPRFIREHCVANRQKPSGIERKESAYRTWLASRLGSKRLDQIGAEDRGAFAREMPGRRASSSDGAVTLARAGELPI